MPPNSPQYSTPMMFDPGQPSAGGLGSGMGSGALASILANAPWAQPGAVMSAAQAGPVAAVPMPAAGMTPGQVPGQGQGGTGHPLLDALASARSWWDGLVQPPSFDTRFDGPGRSGTMRPMHGQMMR